MARTQGPPSAPPFTSAWYITDIDPSATQSLGCDAATIAEDGGAILDFGQPAVQSGTEGTFYYGVGFPFASVDQIETAVQGFLDGYFHCSSGSTALRVIVGTSNFQGDQSAVNAAHGLAWAQMVGSLANYVATSGCGNELAVHGGNDIEPGFGPPTEARDWLSGFASAETGAAVYNYGSCDSCPSSLPDTPEACQAQNGWSCEDIWFVSWGSPGSLAIPEIYLTTLAEQWQTISLYGVVVHNGQVTYSGALSQMGACDCPLSPADAWTALWTALNSDPRTAQSLSWSTDISHQ
ncbi:MAG: hypothetical protein ACRDJE_18475 [Dehalococcoidia bacterium]